MIAGGTTDWLSSSRAAAFRKRSLLIVMLTATAALISGCKSSQYAEWADRDAYGALSEGQVAALGQGYHFDITYNPVDSNRYLQEAEDEALMEIAGRKYRQLRRFHRVMTGLDAALDNVNPPLQTVLTQLRLQERIRSDVVHKGRGWNLLNKKVRAVLSTRPR